ncbi:hypothetical protein TNCV_4796481 [Trichonephila clavipes]|uniref:Uncharacterized protein n=1 Tax=Trichonephila clavipes TaxID=2585209 RepID=A0A8X6S4N4_TRICX|nr:hypothetical protein TNCV_4796481 [Trichonephila clavipes]
MGRRLYFTIMATRLAVSTPRVQTINKGPMATCTGHFIAGETIKLIVKRKMGIHNNRRCHSTDDKRCASVEVEDLITVGILEDIVGFGTDINGCGNFKDGHTVFVIFSSVWVVVVAVEDLATLA